MAGIVARLDPDQAVAAAARANSTVSAGAGSGKTTVLAARYLELLSEGADIGSVLCLTFTRKAAAEMRSRIHRELSASSDPRHRAQLERFSEAQISTIDSFCSLALRSSAQDYGYPPLFAIDDERSRAIAEEEALAFILERREDPTMAELLARLGFERAWKELFADVAYRLCSPAEGADEDFSAMPGRARAALEAETERRAAALRAAAEELLARAGAVAAPGAGATAAIAAARGVVEAPDRASGPGAPEIAQRAAAFASVNMRSFGRSPEETAVKEATKEAREAASALDAALRGAALLPISEAAIGLLAEFGRRYRAAKRRSGTMGFRDAAVCAVDLLGRRPEIRSYWKRRFRYIMIDEFQDDDELQKDLLFLLAERGDVSSAGIPEVPDLDPSKLFFVGDEKQSIYRFRGADVSVFRGLSEDLAREGASLSLAMNYRSEPGIVDFVNCLFERVFGEAVRPFEARFEGMRSRDPTPGVDSEILLLVKPREGKASEESLGDDEALADAVAEYIGRAVESGLRVPSGEKGPGEAAWREARYDDFAILLRSTSKQYILERFLRLRGIPYAAAEPRGLFVESVANDIYNALRLAVLPDDRLAYAAVLRSPLAGLSDDGFVLVLSQGGNAFRSASEEALCDADRARYRRGRGLIETLRERADRESICSLVSYLWYEGGLRLAILSRPEAHPYLEHYDYLFALAARADEEGLCLAAFVASLEPLVGSPEKLGDLNVPREAASGVRIMTIHKSKGLEFPIVLLPWIENRGRDEDAGAAWYLSREAGVTLNLRAYDEPKAGPANVFYEAAKEEDRAMADAEAKRLLYVACTRAISRIVFAAVEPSREDKRGSSFLALLAGGGGMAGPDGLYAQLPPAVRLAQAPPLTVQRYASLASRRSSPRPGGLFQAYAGAGPLDRSFPRRSLSTTSLEQARQAEERASGALPTAAKALPACAYDAYGDRLEEAAFGTLCHAVIERDLGSSDLWSSDLGSGGPSLENALRDIPAELRAPLLAAAEELAASFVRSALWRRMEGCLERRLERGFYLDLGEGLTVSGRIDLFAVARPEEGRSRVDIVDFKTDAERWEGKHDLQLALYREALRDIIPGCKAHSWIFWLRSGEAEERSADFPPERLLRLAREAGKAGLGDLE